MPSSGTAFRVEGASALAPAMRAMAKQRGTLVVSLSSIESRHHLDHRVVVVGWVFCWSLENAHTAKASYRGQHEGLLSSGGCAAVSFPAPAFVFLTSPLYFPFPLLRGMSFWIKDSFASYSRRHAHAETEKERNNARCWLKAAESKIDSALALDHGT